ncbi:Ribosome production factor 2 homolog, partial [Geodia barretti]
MDMQNQGIVKPKTQRAKRALETKAPKLVENTKSALFIRGGHTSETVTQALKDLSVFKKPEAVVLRRKNILRPFEDATSVVSLFIGDFLKKTLTQSSSCSLGFAWQVMSALLLPELI